MPLATTCARGIGPIACAPRSPMERRSSVRSPARHGLQTVNNPTSKWDGKTTPAGKPVRTGRIQLASRGREGARRLQLVRRESEMDLMDSHQSRRRLQHDIRKGERGIDQISKGWRALLHECDNNRPKYARRGAHQPRLVLGNGKTHDVFVALDLYLPFDGRFHLFLLCGHLGSQLNHCGLVSRSQKPHHPDPRQTPGHEVRVGTGGTKSWKW